MHGARTVMTSNAFIRTISVIIMVFSVSALCCTSSVGAVLY